MLHSSEIIKTMRENSDHMESLNKKIRELDDSFRHTTFADIKKKHEEFEKKQLISNAYHKEVNRRSVLGRVLKDNARRAFFVENMPTILEILKKYEGKPVGEKTKQKIAEEAEKKIGHKIFLEGQNSSYDNGKIMICFNGGMFRWEDFRIYLKNGTNKMFDGNKLVVYPIDEYILYYCADYVDDPEAHTDKILSAYENLKKMEKEFDKACGEFNGILPSGIENIYSRNFRSYLI